MNNQDEQGGGDGAGTLLHWRDDAAELLRAHRVDVLSQWHHGGASDRAVEDLAVYLLEAWHQSGETTRTLLGDDDRDILPLLDHPDPCAGQVRLASMVAEAVVAAELADVPARSYNNNNNCRFQPSADEEEEATTTAALAWIHATNADLAAQRTAAWHAARSMLFSASSLHKLLSTPAQYNSLVHEKCTAMRARTLQQQLEEDDKDKEKDSSISTDVDCGPRTLRYKPRLPAAAQMCCCSPPPSLWTAPVFRRVQDARNWGTKMEVLSAAFYCYYNGGAEGNPPELRTDLGCLRHRTHAFLGASPDGVVFGPPGHPKRGYNVEIKNIVDRPITGDPKVEYYVQFQMQMEVCDLHCTDFLETQFREYEFAEDYFLRQTLLPDMPHGLVLHYSPRYGGHGGTGRRGGSIMMWDRDDDDDSSEAQQQQHEKEEKEEKEEQQLKAEWMYSAPGQPLRTREEVDAWICLQSAARPTMVLDEVSYWCLEIYSCVSSDRNREWFAAVLPAIAEAWRTVERESAEGFDHRAPGGAAARRTRACAASTAALWGANDDMVDDAAEAEEEEKEGGVVVVVDSVEEEEEEEEVAVDAPPPANEDDNFTTVVEEEVLLLSPAKKRRRAKRKDEKIDDPQVAVVKRKRRQPLDDAALLLFCSDDAELQ